MTPQPETAQRPAQATAAHATPAATAAADTGAPLSRASDLPAYDVLRQKYYATPDGLAAVQQEFGLPQIPAPAPRAAVYSYDPVANKVIPAYTAGQQIFGRDRADITTQKTPAADTRPAAAGQPAYDALAGKIVAADTSQCAFALIPAARPNGPRPGTAIIKDIVELRPRAERGEFTGVDWITAALGVMVVLLAYARMAFGKHFAPLFGALASISVANRIYKERNMVFDRFSTILEIVFFMATAAFGALCFDYHGLRLVGHGLWGNYLAAMLALAAVVVLKIVVLSTIVFSLGIEGPARELRFHRGLARKSAGLAIVPLVAAMPYADPAATPYLIHGVVAILGLSYLFMALRLLRVSLKTGFPLYCMILYFCAVELGPIAVAVKACGSMILGR